MKVGYIRVSTAEQNTARQEVLLEELGVSRVYIDKMSGKSADRPKLKEMLEFVREGDMIVVEFISKKENIDTTTPAGKFMLTVFAAVAELERGYILDRQREGIAIAKSEGKYKGRPPKKIDEDLWNDLYARWKNGEITAVEFMKKVELRKSAFYERVKMAR